MGMASNELESRLGRFLLMTAMPEKPSALWLGLYLNYSIPRETTEEGLEVSRTFFGSDTGYSRILCGPADAWWSENSSVPGQFYNVQTLQFPAALLSWGTITGWALHPTAMGGSHWISGFLTSPFQINSGDPAASFAPGALVINFF